MPNTVAIRDLAREERDRYAGEQRTPMDAMGLPPEEETAVTMSSLNEPAPPLSIQDGKLIYTIS